MRECKCSLKLLRRLHERRLVPFHPSAPPPPCCLGCGCDWWLEQSSNFTLWGRLTSGFLLCEKNQYLLYLSHSILDFYVQQSIILTKLSIFSLLIQKKKNVERGLRKWGERANPNGGRIPGVVYSLKSFQYQNWRSALLSHVSGMWMSSHTTGKWEITSGW